MAHRQLPVRGVRGRAGRDVTTALAWASHLDLHGHRSTRRSTMRVPGRVLALAALLALPAQLWATDTGRPDRRSCPADVDAAVAQHCPCDGSRNHGQYVSGAAHYGNALRKTGCRAGTAVRLTRCPVLSTCGKPGAVVCCTTICGTCEP